jgi:hypothetical protein
MWINRAADNDADRLRGVLLSAGLDQDVLQQHPAIPQWSVGLVRAGTERGQRVGLRAPPEPYSAAGTIGDF